MPKKLLDFALAWPCASVVLALSLLLSVLGSGALASRHLARTLFDSGTFWSENGSTSLQVYPVKSSTSSNLESRMHLSTELYVFGLCVFIVLLYRLLGLLFRLCLYYLFFCFPRVDWKANSRFSSAFWTLQDRPTLSLTLLQSFAMLRVFSSFLSAFSAGFSACKLTKKHWVSESSEWSEWRNHRLWMIHAKLNKFPHLSRRVFLLYLLQLSELLDVSILQLDYDWCLCQDSVTKSFFFTSLLFAVSPMAKNLAVTLSALQVFHGWLKKLCGSVRLLGLWPSSETENIQLQKAHMAMVSSLSCVLWHFLVPILGPLSVMWSCFSPFWGSFQQNQNKFSFGTSRQRFSRSFS